MRRNVYETYDQGMREHGETPPQSPLPPASPLLSLTFTFITATIHIDIVQPQRLSVHAQLVITIDIPRLDLILASRFIGCQSNNQSHAVSLTTRRKWWSVDTGRRMRMPPWVVELQSGCGCDYRAMLMSGCGYRATDDRIFLTVDLCLRPRLWLIDDDLSKHSASTLPPENVHTTF